MAACPWSVSGLFVSEMLDEAGRGFAAGWRCASPHTCSASSVISTCPYTQIFPLHCARLLLPAQVFDRTVPVNQLLNHPASSISAIPYNLYCPTLRPVQKRDSPPAPSELTFSSYQRIILVINKVTFHVTTSLASLLGPPVL